MNPLPPPPPECAAVLACGAATRASPARCGREGDTRGCKSSGRKTDEQMGMQAGKRRWSARGLGREAGILYYNYN